MSIILDELETERFDRVHRPSKHPEQRNDSEGVEPARRSSFKDKKIIMNAELVKKALEKVGNPNILVNLISRRVRQLNSGGGMRSRPLVADTGNLGVADIALLEIVEEKMHWELPELVELKRPVGRKLKKH